MTSETPGAAVPTILTGAATTEEISEAIAASPSAGVFHIPSALSFGPSASGGLVKRVEVEAVKLPPRYPAKVLVAFMDSDDPIPFWSEYLELQDMSISLEAGAIEDGRINLSFSIRKLPESPRSDPDYGAPKEDSE